MLIQQSPIVAHRGGAKRAPENTLASARHAYASGASSMELDVGLSSDGEFYILHDETLDRTTNGKGRLDQTTAAELDQLDAGSWFASEFAGERVPRLADALDFAKDRIHFTIEMKASAAKPGVAERLVGMLREREMTEQVSVISFASDFVHTVENLAPEIDTGVLLSERPTVSSMKIGMVLAAAAGLVGSLAGQVHPIAGLGIAVAAGALGSLTGKWVSSKSHQAMVKKVGVDTLLPFWFDADKGLVKAAQAAGKRVVPYTANHPFLVNHLVANGVAAVITDVPENYCSPRFSSGGITP
jgi:glycerophosphoryl diester phosphodiesterase